MSPAETGAAETGAAETDTVGVPGPPRLLIGGLAAVAAVLLLLSLILALRVSDDQAQQAAAFQQERVQVLEVARQQAINLTSLSSTDFESDLSQIRELSTGAFARNLDRTLAALRETLSASAFEQSSVLLASGVSELDGDTASVLLALDQTLRSGQRSRTDALRLQLDLVRTEGRWLVDNVIYQPSTVSAQAPLPTATPSAGQPPVPSAQPR